MPRGQRNSAATTFRNLVFNPQFALAASNTTIRTNLAPNGNAVSATGWFSAGPTTSGVSANQSGGANGRTYARASVTATSSGVNYFAIAYGQPGGGINAAQVSAGKTYMLSMYVRATMVTFSQPQVRLRWKTSAGTTLSDVTATASGATSGNWIRLNVSGMAPASASYVEALGGFYSIDTSTLHVGDTIDVNSVLVEASVNLDSYFDGATSAAGDYTYAWAGAVNASTSNQRALQPANVASSTNSGSFPDAKFFAFQSVAEDGHNTVKWLAPRNTGTSQWKVGGWQTPAFDYTRIKANHKYTLMFRHRSSGWGTGQTVGVYMQTGSGTNGLYTGDTVALNVGWTEYRKVFVASIDGYSNLWMYLSLPAIPQVATDGVFEMRDWMLIEGDYVGDIIDGTKPFSKWEGAANASTSIGYPPQLSDIAGSPFYDGSNIAQLTDIALPNGPITIYSVQNTNNNSNNPGFWEITTGSGTAFPTTGVFRFIVNGTSLRFDNMTTGNVLYTASIPGTGTSLQVLTASADPTNLGTEVQVNNGSTILVAPNASYRVATSGYYLRVGARDSVSDGVIVTTKRLLIYSGKHSIDTRMAIARYLGSQYGVVVS